MKMNELKRKYPHVYEGIWDMMIDMGDEPNTQGFIPKKYYSKVQTAEKVLRQLKGKKVKDFIDHNFQKLALSTYELNDDAAHAVVTSDDHFILRKFGKAGQITDEFFIDIYNNKIPNLYWDTPLPTSGKYEIIGYDSGRKHQVYLTNNKAQAIKIARDHFKYVAVDKVIVKDTTTGKVVFKEGKNVKT